VKRVLLTGMSGTGKSSVIAALAARGYKTVDTDYGGWCEAITIPTSADRSGLGVTEEFVWQEERIAVLLSTEDTDVLFVSGCTSNQSKFYSRFDHVVLLSAPISVMKERLSTRSNNPYGKSPEDLARVLALKETVEPMLRRGADIELDTGAPLDHVVDQLLASVGLGTRRP